MPYQPFDADALGEEIAVYLSNEGRRWLADLLHNHLGGRITNASLQAEIVLRAWDRRPEMARSEMQALKTELDEGARFLVALVRAVTPPAVD